MSCASLSELRPNCIRCSFRMSSFRLSISFCFSTTSSLNASESSAVRSGRAVATCGIVQPLTDRTGLNLTSVFGFVLYRQLWRMGALWASPVNAFQQHRQLRSRQRYTAALSLRPDKAAAFQSLRKQTQTVAIPPQHLDQIATTTTKHEDMAGKRILFKNCLYRCAQSGKATAKIGYSRSDPHLCPGR